MVGRMTDEELFAIYGDRLKEPYTEAFSWLIELKGLKDNWDGYGGFGISDEVYWNAIFLLNRLEQAQIRAPESINPTPSGTITFDWGQYKGPVWACVEVGMTRCVGFLEREGLDLVYLQGHPKEVSLEGFQP